MLVLDNRRVRLPPAVLRKECQMKFEQLYSSSKANLYVVTSDSGKKLLIECGVTKKKLLKALKYDMKNIVGCLISHSHKDHSKGIWDVLNSGIKVYASYATFKAYLTVHALRFGKALVLTEKQSIKIPPEFSVYPFGVEHDCNGTLGFIISCDKEAMLFVTDTAFIKQRFETAFNIIAIECSYDKDLLYQRQNTGEVNETVAKRLIYNHQEKDVALRYLSESCQLTECREIHLLHLSGGNIRDKETVRKEFEDKLFIKTIVI